MEKRKELFALVNGKKTSLRDIDAYFLLEEKSVFDFDIQKKSEVAGVCIVTGKVEDGAMFVGRDLKLVRSGEKERLDCRCAFIEHDGRWVKSCQKGDFVSLGIDGLGYTDVQIGDTLSL